MALGHSHIPDGVEKGMVLLTLMTNHEDITNLTGALVDMKEKTKEHRVTWMLTDDDGKGNARADAWLKGSDGAERIMDVSQEAQHAAGKFNLTFTSEPVAPVEPLLAAKTSFEGGAYYRYSWHSAHSISKWMQENMVMKEKGLK